MTETLARGRVAVVSYHSVGDGLIYLQLADILKQNGCSVTLYSTVIGQLSDWFPNHCIEPIPVFEELGALVEQHELLIADHLSRPFVELSAERMSQLAEFSIFTGAVKVPDEYQIQNLSDAGSRCGVFLRGGCFIEKPSSSRTAADWICFYAKTRLGLFVPENHRVAFSAPEGLRFRSKKKRVVIAPESPDPRKNWRPDQFLALADRLRREGYDPVFVTAPAECERWEGLLAGRFVLAATPTLHELACLLYESGAAIANDSGCGHMASFLGLPVLTVFRRPVRHFKWRPGWGPSRVIGPYCSFRLWGKRRWQCFLPPGRVLRAFKKLMD